MRWVLIISIAMLSGDALAQNAEQRAASDALFDEAKKLVIAGDYARACPKFEASLKLVMRLGAQLNLADCYEKAGRTASAWGAFREAASMAARTSDGSREKFARERAAALEPYLAKLTIKVAVDNRVPELTITRDGTIVPAEIYDASVPVDPGDHIIHASAPNMQQWSQRITVVREKGHTVEVPRLAPQPATQNKDKVTEEPDEPDEEVAPAPGRTRKIAAITIGGGGVLLLGAATVIAVVAKSRWDSAFTDHCDDDNRCDAEGLKINSNARTLGNIATVTGIVGLAAVAGGVVLYLTAPKAAERSATLTPIIRRDGGGIALGGTF